MAKREGKIENIEGIYDMSPDRFFTLVSESRLEALKYSDKKGSRFRNREDQRQFLQEVFAFMNVKGEGVNQDIERIIEILNRHESVADDLDGDAKREAHYDINREAIRALNNLREYHNITEESPEEEKGVEEKVGENEAEIESESFDKNGLPIIPEKPQNLSREDFAKHILFAYKLEEDVFEVENARMPIFVRLGSRKNRFDERMQQLGLSPDDVAESVPDLKKAEAAILHSMGTNDIEDIDDAYNAWTDFFEKADILREFLNEQEKELKSDVGNVKFPEEPQMKQWNIREVRLLAVAYEKKIEAIFAELPDGLMEEGTELARRKAALLGKVATALGRHSKITKKVRPLVQNDFRELHLEIEELETNLPGEIPQLEEAAKKQKEEEEEKRREHEERNTQAEALSQTLIDDENFVMADDFELNESTKVGAIYKYMRRLRSEVVERAREYGVEGAATDKAYEITDAELAGLKEFREEFKDLAEFLQEVRHEKDDKGKDIRNNSVDKDTGSSTYEEVLADTSGYTKEDLEEISERFGKLKEAAQRVFDHIEGDEEGSTAAKFDREWKNADVLLKEFKRPEVIADPRFKSATETLEKLHRLYIVRLDHRSQVKHNKASIEPLFTQLKTDVEYLVDLEENHKDRVAADEQAEIERVKEENIIEKQIPERMSKKLSEVFGNEIDVVKRTGKFYEAGKGIFSKPAIADQRLSKYMDNAPEGDPLAILINEIKTETKLRERDKKESVESFLKRAFRERIKSERGGVVGVAGTLA